MRGIEFVSTIRGSISRRVGRLSSYVHRSKQIPFDVLETDDNYIVIFDVPGVDSEDIQVRYVDNRILVRVDRFREYFEGFTMRFPGRGMGFDGEAELPDTTTVDPEAATARLSETGVLTIEVPKDATAPTETLEEVEIDE